MTNFSLVVVLKIFFLSIFQPTKCCKREVIDDHTQTQNPYISWGPITASYNPNFTFLQKHAHLSLLSFSLSHSSAHTDTHKHGHIPEQAAVVAFVLPVDLT